MYSAQARCRQEEPGTGIYKVLGRSSVTSVHLGEFTLSAGQPLFGGSQHPFHGLGSVAFDGIAIVIHITVVEDTKVKLRRGITACGGNKEVVYNAALHQNIQTTGREASPPNSANHPVRIQRRLSSHGLWIIRVALCDRHLPRTMPHGVEMIKIQ